MPMIHLQHLMVVMTTTTIATKMSTTLYQSSSSQAPNTQSTLKEPRVSTVNKVLSYLLRQPELAINCEIPEEVYKLKAHNIDLLIELLNYIKTAETRVSTAMILGHWHNTSEGYLLASLAAAETLAR